MTKELMNKVSANTAARIVQMQSVHLRSFSSTGKFRNVYTLFLNMGDKILFQYCMPQFRIRINNISTHSPAHNHLSFMIKAAFNY